MINKAFIPELDNNIRSKQFFDFTDCCIYSTEFTLPVKRGRGTEAAKLTLCFRDCQSLNNNFTRRFL